MNGTLQFFIIINLVGVFACICAALILLGLMISDQLYKRRKLRNPEQRGQRA